jgi:chromatin segregation and condensation protein Rec8/ScpA/Scc1 (kleisin family)
MIALRLVRLIESHSEGLAESLLHKLERSSRAADLKKVPGHEVRERAREVYRNLSDWLLAKTDDDIEHVYKALGRRRAEQGVSMSALCWALLMTEENLWEFLEMEGMREKPLEILGSLELLRLLDQFFDQAVYFATLGYETYWREKQAEESASLAHLA